MSINRITTSPGDEVRGRIGRLPPVSISRRTNRPTTPPTRSVLRSLASASICAWGLGLALPGAAQERVPLYDDLGTHHYRITTTVPEAQRYFDQGLRLTYAFNHAEAVRAFEEAARLDPDCAMCRWGIALALGPNINAPMDEAAGRAAVAAIRSAESRLQGATAKERELVRALAARYADPPPAERASLDTAWADALGELARRYPEDLEIATLHAEALMNLSPWNYWERDGTARPATLDVVSTLERVLERNPNHPGACHFYIHAVEAAHPEKAVPCADRLAALMPGAGHLVHMPAHIYIRVGRWNDAIESNVHAVHADESYIADQRPGGIYPLFYYPHNHHFLSFAAAMAGRSREAVEAARRVSEGIDPELARDIPELQGLLPTLPLTLVTFGRWEEVLAVPLPGEELPFARAMGEYARGVALAATNRPAEAEGALERVEAAAGAIAAEPARTVLEIAAFSLRGEVAMREGRPDEAVGHFQAAARLEDELQYMEPPFWYYPVRHSLGAALLAAGRPEEAEREYRADLERFPENGWSLHGLAESLRAQGRQGEAAEVEGRLAGAWNRADVRLIASRF